ncbi:MAG: ABC transporter substrate-binding protein [Clostridium sulfidigenes]|uniref:ABC transporter substrate-binding protein n=1 Tax=Clostridium sulfidigenes TaxID=318464 RepID=A0A927W8S7_9CLOT|nr:ABC transporter substrate-binding protein [Clostridium sulfidigenes]
MKKLKVLGALTLIVVMLTACSNRESKNNEEKDNTINIVTSFYGMQALTEEIGGDKVSIESVIPEAMEPHDFDIKAKDMKAIEEADIFIYNGAGMESWIEDVEAAISGKELIVVEASKGVELINADEESEEHEEDEGHNHSGKDPHTWLGLSEAKIQGENIKNALVEKDVKNKEYYEENLKKFNEKIDNIIKEYNPKFKELANKNFVTGHATFGYLCRDFGLTQKSIEGVFAEGEPSPKELQNLMEYCKVNNIKTIFVEELISTQLSDTLAKEVGAQTKQIYTLHSNEDGKSFSDVLKYNVETIYSAMNNK